MQNNNKYVPVRVRLKNGIEDSYLASGVEKYRCLFLFFLYLNQTLHNQERGTLESLAHVYSLPLAAFDGGLLVPVAGRPVPE